MSRVARSDDLHTFISLIRSDNLHDFIPAGKV